MPFYFFRHLFCIKNSFAEKRLLANVFYRFTFHCCGKKFFLPFCNGTRLVLACNGGSTGNCLVSRNQSCSVFVQKWRFSRQTQLPSCKLNPLLCAYAFLQGWLVDLINKFGTLNGFQMLHDRFMSGQALNVQIIAALIK